MGEERITVYVLQPDDRPSLQLQWVDPATGRRKTRSAGTSDPKKAEDQRKDLEYELNHGKYQEASRVTWERFRELFEEEYVGGLKPGSRDVYAQVLDRFERLCRPTLLRSVSARTLSSFAAAMRREKKRGKGGYAPKTIHTTLRLLRAALNWAKTQKLILEVPAFPEVRLPKKKPQPVPEESFQKLLQGAKDEMMRAYLRCGWLAGLRLEEAYLLEWEPTDKAPYLDLARNRIVLPAEYVKGAEDQWVPLDWELRRALEALPREGKRIFRFVGRGGVVLKRGSVSDRIVRLAKKVGVKLSMRSLRRGFGCYYAARSPAQVLQKLMRHSNISITMDYYANVDRAVEEAVRTRHEGEKPNAAPNAGREGPRPPERREAASPSTSTGKG
jgi:integrase